MPKWFVEKCCEKDGFHALSGTLKVGPTSCKFCGADFLGFFIIYHPLPKKKDSEYPPFPSSLINEESIIELCLETKQVLAKEPHVVEVDGLCRLFGDIHGQFIDLLQFFNLYGSPDNLVGNRDMSFVFLGDFVDRGYEVLEDMVLFHQV